MAAIAIVAGGTRGDVQPYIALGKGLRGAGHTVRVLTSDSFATLVTGAGLGFGSTGGSVEEVLQSAEWRKTIERGNVLAIFAKMQAETRRRAVGTGHRLQGLLAGSDLIVAGIAGLGGAFSAAAALRLPVIQAYVTPFTPTRAFPSPLTPALPFGGALNRASFAAMRQALWQTSRASDVAVRRELGLPKGSFRGPFRALSRSTLPVLHGYSEYVLPRPDDWPAHHHVTGYWFLDAEAGWVPPPDLAAFLAAGDPPVYIGFGSMIGGNPQELGRIALEALGRTGQRGVFATGWGGLSPSDLPGTVHAVGSVPHDWLFPRMAAVVHHGGVGTTAAALRAGMPSVVVPFGVDQPYWGRRVAELGVGTAPIPQKRLTVERLSAAIAESIGDPAIRRRAAALRRCDDCRAGKGDGHACHRRGSDRPAPGMFWSIMSGAARSYGVGGRVRAARRHRRCRAPSPVARST